MKTLSTRSFVDKSTQKDEISNKTGNGKILFYIINILLQQFYYLYLLESPTIITESSLNEDMTEIKVEPDDFHGSNVNPSKETDVTPNRPELIKNIEKSLDSTTGKLNLNVSILNLFIVLFNLY